MSFLPLGTTLFCWSPLEKRLFESWRPIEDLSPSAAAEEVVLSIFHDRQPVKENRCRSKWCTRTICFNTIVSFDGILLSFLNCKWVHWQSWNCRFGKYSVRLNKVSEIGFTHLSNLGPQAINKFVSFMIHSESDVVTLPRWQILFLSRYKNYCQGKECPGGTSDRAFWG